MSIVRSQTIASRDCNSFAVLSMPDDIEENWAEFLEEFDDSDLYPLPQTFGEVVIHAEQLGLVVTDMTDVFLGPEDHIETSYDPPVYEKYVLPSGQKPGKKDIPEERWNTFLRDWNGLLNQKEDVLPSCPQFNGIQSGAVPDVLTHVGTRVPAQELPPGTGYFDRVSAIQGDTRSAKRRRNRVPHHAYRLVTPARKITSHVRSKSFTEGKNASEILQGLRSGELKVIKTKRQSGDGYVGIKYYLVRTATLTSEGIHPDGVIGMVEDMEVYDHLNLSSTPIKEDVEEHELG